MKLGINKLLILLFFVRSGYFAANEDGFVKLEIRIKKEDDLWSRHLRVITGSVDENTRDANDTIAIYFTERVGHLHKGSIRNLPNLELIVIDHKGLRSISSYAFENLDTIEKIVVNRNKLQQIPKHVFAYLPVKEIELQDNHISVIEEGAFAYLNNLEHLDLSGNELKHWNPNFIGSSTPNLNYINLFNNSLIEIEANAFKIWDNLTWLHLSDNLISDVHPKAFHGNFWLNVLGLDGNKLEKIDPDMVIGRESPGDAEFRLRLGKNNLKYLPEKFLRGLKYATVELKKNPIFCNCLAEMKKWLLENVTLKFKQDSCIRTDSQNCSLDISTL